MNDAAKRITLSRLIGGKGSIIFASLFLFPAMLFLYMGHFFPHDAKRSINWPSTQGVVTFSKIEEQRHAAQNLKGDSLIRDEDVLDITYSYRVNGVEYESDRVAFGLGMGLDELEGKLRQAVKGSQITVFYDPEDPSVAVLEPGGEYLLFLYALFFNLGLILLIPPAVYYLLRLLSLTVVPALKVDTSRNMKHRLRGASGPLDYILKGNLIQRVTMLIMFPLLFLAFLGWMGVGVHLVYLGVDGYIHPNGDQRWPQARGLIVRSEMTQEVARRLNSSGSSDYTRYYLEVEIEYRVTTGRYLLYDYHSTDDGDRAETLRAEYPRGASLTVYYNPDDPQEGQLMPKEPHGLGIAGLGLVMTLPWLAAIYAMWHRREKKRDAKPARGGRKKKDN